MKKRRILLALIMLIISGISLTTATYAWFTANSQVSVEQIDIQATTTGGIQISADAENWSNVVSLKQLRDVNDTADLGISNYIPEYETSSLKPLTTIGVNQTTGKFDFFLGTLNNAGDNVELIAEEEGDGNLVAFDLYFYSAKEQTIIFDTGTIVQAKDAEDDAKLTSSMRVGFLFQGNDLSDAAAVRAKTEGTVDDQVIWEPNSTTHTQYAINQLDAVDGEVSDTLGGKTATGEDVYVATDSEDYFTLVDESLGLVRSTAAEKHPSDLSWDLAAGINKFRVYIWIEGQDIDCEDTASLGAGITAKLAFTIEE